MADESRFAVADDISFADAIVITKALLDELEQSGSAPLEATVSALVRSENGARGFFVTYLSDDRPFADQPTPAIIACLSLCVGNVRVDFCAGCWAYEISGLRALKFCFDDGIFKAYS